MVGGVWDGDVYVGAACPPAADSRPGFVSLWHTEDGVSKLTRSNLAWQGSSLIKYVANVTPEFSDLGLPWAGHIPYVNMDLFGVGILSSLYGGLDYLDVRTQRQVRG